MHRPRPHIVLAAIAKDRWSVSTHPLIGTVMLIEVEDGKTEAEAYVPRQPDGRSAADYIIFTPRAQRPDSCGQVLDIKT